MATQTCFSKEERDEETIGKMGIEEDNAVAVAVLGIVRELKERSRSGYLRAQDPHNQYRALLAHAASKLGATVERVASVLSGQEQARIRLRNKISRSVACILNLTYRSSAVALGKTLLDTANAPGFHFSSGREVQGAEEGEEEAPHTSDEGIGARPKSYRTGLTPDSDAMGIHSTSKEVYDAWAVRDYAGKQEVRLKLRFEIQSNIPSDEHPVILCCWITFGQVVHPREVAMLKVPTGSGRKSARVNLRSLFQAKKFRRGGEGGGDSSTPEGSSMAAPYHDSIPADAAVNFSLTSNRLNPEGVSLRQQVGFARVLVRDLVARSGLHSQYVLRPNRHDLDSVDLLVPISSTELGLRAKLFQVSVDYAHTSHIESPLTSSLVPENGQVKREWYVNNIVRRESSNDTICIRFSEAPPSLQRQMCSNTGHMHLRSHARAAGYRHGPVLFPGWSLACTTFSSIPPEAQFLHMIRNACAYNGISFESWERALSVLADTSIADDDIKTVCRKIGTDPALVLGIPVSAAAILITSTPYDYDYTIGGRPGESRLKRKKRWSDANESVHFMETVFSIWYLHGNDCEDEGIAASDLLAAISFAKDEWKSPVMRSLARVFKWFGFFSAIGTAKSSRGGDSSSSNSTNKTGVGHAAGLAIPYALFGEHLDNTRPGTLDKTLHFPKLKKRLKEVPAWATEMAPLYYEGTSPSTVILTSLEHLPGCEYDPRLIRMQRSREHTRRMRSNILDTIVGDHRFFMECPLSSYVTASEPADFFLDVNTLIPSDMEGLFRIPDSKERCVLFSALTYVDGDDTPPSSYRAKRKVAHRKGAYEAFVGKTQSAASVVFSAFTAPGAREPYVKGASLQNIVLSDRGPSWLDEERGRAFTYPFVFKPCVVLHEVDEFAVVRRDHRMLDPPVPGPPPPGEESYQFEAHMNGRSEESLCAAPTRTPGDMVSGQEEEYVKNEAKHALALADSTCTGKSYSHISQSVTRDVGRAISELTYIFKTLGIPIRADMVGDAAQGTSLDGECAYLSVSYYVSALVSSEQYRSGCQVALRRLYNHGKFVDKRKEVRLLLLRTACEYAVIVARVPLPHGHPSRHPTSSFWPWATL